MPQPLSKVRPNANVVIGNSDTTPSVHRPALALLAMKVLAEWSILESFLSALFVQMLGANPAPAAAIFQAVHAAQARDAAFRALARISLSEQENDVFEAILKRLNTVVKPRNDIAHWVWGYCFELPNSVLLIDPEILMRWTVGMEEFSRELRAGNRHADAPEFPRESTFVYEEADFIKASSDILEAMYLITRFRFHLMHDRAGIEVADTLPELLSEPEIQTFVHARVLARQKSQAAQQ